MLDEIVGEWLSLPELADRVDEPVARVRQWLRDGRLVAIRRGEPAALQVPASFVREGALLKGLVGTLTLLHDCGFTSEAALRWLFTTDPSLPGTPVDALVAGRGGEVRRRAQALAL